MKRFAAIVTCLFLGTLSVGALGCSGDDDDGADVDGGDAAGPLPDARIDAGVACNPVAQTGCLPGEKCTWIVDSAGPPELGHTGCATEGAATGGAACTAPETGADDCVAGFYCLNSVCNEICTSAPNSCPAGSICSTYSNFMEDIENVGLCNPTCDPVEQNCANAAEACYLQAVTGEASCAGIPAGAEGVTQGQTCYGPEAGVCYLNGCDKGFGANLPDGECAFFCNPIDNWSTNQQGLTGDSAGITCSATFGGARPDGPGPSFECRYIQTFYGNTESVAATTGMCLAPADWGGSCAIFDYDQLVLDIASGAADSETYCTDFEDRCMFDCVSLATYEALFAASPFQPQWERFKMVHVKKFWDQRAVDLGL